MRTVGPASGWTLRETSGSAAELHDRRIPEPPRPSVWIHRVAHPALVLGSTQHEADLVAGGERMIASEPDASGPGGVDPDLEVCRRRSGGGLVSLLPGNDLWIDVIVPSPSRLWVDDVGEAGLWLGDVWASTLATVLPAGAIAPTDIRVHRGPLQQRDAGRLVCFAGLGPGEVTVDGRKVVGLSQRRTREAARFQTVMTWSWPGRWLADHLTEESLRAAGLDRRAVVDLPAGLPPRALVTGRRPSTEAVVAAFLRHLPHP